MNFFSKMVLGLLVVSLVSGKTQASENHCSYASPMSPSLPVFFNTNYAYDMLDDATNINRKQLLLLRSRQEGLLKNKSFYLSAGGTFIGDTQVSNRTDKFGYLMRHPTSANQVGKQSSELLIHNAKLAVTGTMDSWLTGHLQFLYYPNQSFGGGTNVNVNRNQVELRRGYLLVGDLDFFPVYVSVGKMASPFGLTDTVNPFTASTVWHAFGGLAYGAQMGVDYKGFNAEVMLVQGGAQFRALNSGHPTPSKVENFVFNGSYTFNHYKNICWRIGASYEHGSAYIQDFPILHFMPNNGYHNPAWAIYTKLDIYDFTLIAEFVETTKIWPGTKNPHPPLDVFCASKVSSFDVGARYVFHLPQQIKMAISADFSNFKSGPSNSPWERQNQLVIGLEFIIKHNIRFFAEYIHTQGFAPLNLLSGNTPDFKKDSTTERVPATTISDRDARSNVFLVGGKVSF